jgi:hypothetical protein
MSLKDIFIKDEKDESVNGTKNWCYLYCNS